MVKKLNNGIEDFKRDLEKMGYLIIGERLNSIEDLKWLEIFDVKKEEFLRKNEYSPLFSAFIDSEGKVIISKHEDGFTFTEKIKPNLLIQITYYLQGNKKIEYNIFYKDNNRVERPLLRINITDVKEEILSIRIDNVDKKISLNDRTVDSYIIELVKIISNSNIIKQIPNIQSVVKFILECVKDSINSIINDISNEKDSEMISENTEPEGGKVFVKKSSKSRWKI